VLTTLRDEYHEAMASGAAALLHTKCSTCCLGCKLGMTPKAMLLILMAMVDSSGKNGNGCCRWQCQDDWQLFLAQIQVECIGIIMPQQ
jgi:hypothetical protein